MRVLAFNVAHDSSVCSYVDGQIEFYCKEERLTREKRDDCPFKALDLYHQQNFGPIDHILYHCPSSTPPESILDDGFKVIEKYIYKKFDKKLNKFDDMRHHQCHASSAFYNSGFSTALVFVIDRNGSMFFNDDRYIGRESESVYKVSYPHRFIPLYKSFQVQDRANRFIDKSNIENYYKGKCSLYNERTPKISISNEFGIVRVYEAATTLMNQDALENGKTMGLSSYGSDDGDYPSLFLDGVPISNYFDQLIEMGDASTIFDGYVRHIIRDINQDNYQLYADKAKHVQLETQKESLRLIEEYVNKTGIQNVCITGGYGLNVVANNYYIKNLPDVNFYFDPLADDSGVSIGAAMLKYRFATGDKKIYKQKDNFYHYYKKSNMVIWPRNHWPKEDKTINDVVDILKDQKVVAIFDGAPEAGPRALGHRSLLFDPRNKDGKDLVNTLKKREWYRPFAGVILEDYFSEYFETLGLSSSEYMTINFDCKDKTRDYVPSIVHVDNTCRIQTVNSGFLFDLLKEFYNQTGCPMLLNTSFNLAGDPLIQSEDDAIEFIDKVGDQPVFGGVYFVDENYLVT